VDTIPYFLVQGAVEWGWHDGGGVVVDFGCWCLIVWFVTCIAGDGGKLLIVRSEESRSSRVLL
jgi:hypothetical protein